MDELLLLQVTEDVSTHCSPFSSLISLVLTFVWQPAPFQLPFIGLGSSDATTPKSSHTRYSRKRATHRWSPISIPSQGPTWNSHWSQRKQRQIVKGQSQCLTKRKRTIIVISIHCALIKGHYLRWHNFSIGAIDFDPCIEAGFVVALHNVSSISILCPHPTVVLSLKWVT